MHGLELGPCLGGAVERLTGAGVGSEVFSAKSRTAVWVSGVGGVGEALVLVSPARPRFVIDQLGPFHEPALAAPQLDLGCEWIF